MGAIWDSCAWTPSAAEVVPWGPVHCGVCVCSRGGDHFRLWLSRLCLCHQLWRFDYPGGCGRSLYRDVADGAGLHGGYGVVLPGLVILYLNEEDLLFFIAFGVVFLVLCFAVGMVYVHRANRLLRVGVRPVHDEILAGSEEE